MVWLCQIYFSDCVYTQEKNIIDLTNTFCSMSQDFWLNQQKYLFDLTKS